MGHTLRGCVDWNYWWLYALVCLFNVTPCVGVWIETDNQSQTISYNSVTPCVGVWIETCFVGIIPSYLYKSHPAWVCGLKLAYWVYTLQANCHTLRGCVDWNCSSTVLLRIEKVTPCVGVWIETWCEVTPYPLLEVTPCVGVWIETNPSVPMSGEFVSHPAWVCGLKPSLSPW